MQTNLQFDKSSQEQINPLEKLTNFIGSFNVIKDEIN